VSFLRFFLGIKKYAQDIEFVDNLNSELFCHSFTNGKFRLFSILPPRSAKGAYFDQTDTCRLKFEDPSQNDLSFALRIEYAGTCLVLGGDASAKSWNERRRRIKAPLGASIAKLPHHGAKEECSPKILDYIYGSRGKEESTDAFALISAAGRSHPSPDVLASLRERSIKPYCTSRSTKCGASPVRDLIAARHVDPGLLRDINSRAVSANRNGPCQGDVTVEITDLGSVSVKPAFPTPCGFR
jgi:hypothetical protein